MKRNMQFCGGQVVNHNQVFKRANIKNNNYVHACKTLYGKNNVSKRMTGHISLAGCTGAMQQHRVHTDLQYPTPRPVCLRAIFRELHTNTTLKILTFKILKLNTYQNISALYPVIAFCS